MGKRLSYAARRASLPFRTLNEAMMLVASGSRPSPIVIKVSGLSVGSAGTQ